MSDDSDACPIHATYALSCKLLTPGMCHGLSMHSAYYPWLVQLSHEYFVSIATGHTCQPTNALRHGHGTRTWHTDMAHGHGSAKSVHTGSHGGMDVACYALPLQTLQQCRTVQGITFSTPPHMPQLLTDTDSFRLVPMVATCMSYTALCTTSHVVIVMTFHFVQGNTLIPTCELVQALLMLQTQSLCSDCSACVHCSVPGL